MPMRLSGLMSGMDTESVIQQLVAARRTKVDDAKKAQTKLQWKTDAWKTLNSKIKKLYDGALSNLRFEGSYMKKTTKVSNSSVVSVITGADAMNTVQTLEVSRMARSAYLTGGEVGARDQKGKMDLDSDSRLSKMGWDFSDTGKINVTVGDRRTEINVTGATTIGELVQAFRDAGVNASFDTKNQRFYLSSKDTGEDNDFTITAGDMNGLFMMEDLGLSYVDDNVTGYYDSITKWKQDEVVESRLQGRLDSRLKELTDRQADWKNRIEGFSSKVEELKEQYATELDGASTSEEIKNKISDLILSDTLDDDTKAGLTDLYANLDALEEAETQLADVENKLDEDEEGNVVLSEEEAASVKKTVEDEVAHEVADAEEMIKILNEAATNSGAHKQDAQSAIIKLNGVEYKGSRNTFEINGLTLTLHSDTKESGAVTLTTEDDTDGIYDMIKSFIKEYSELINEMDKLYNAEPSKGYEPLTSEEKESMSEKEIEEWEAKIKDSILRRDDTLGTISSALKQMMLTGITVNGKQMSMSTFGIGSLSYFTAAENEKNAFHIDGDPDDPYTSGNEDKLKALIASDPRTVVDFFVEFSRSMYADLTNRMAKTEYSSAYTIYEDVKMKSEYDSYTSKIKELEKKLADYEDKWYAKFAKMETALSKLQSNVSAVTSLLGG